MMKEFKRSEVRHSKTGQKYAAMDAASPAPIAKPVDPLGLARPTIADLRGSGRFPSITRLVRYKMAMQMLANRRPGSNPMPSQTYREVFVW